MLEAIVSVRYQGERGCKLRGDILAVKLANSPWSREEKSRGLFIEWADEALAAQLLSQVSRVNPHPVAVYPYARYDDEGNMTVRSTVAIDIDSMSATLKQDILDPTKQVTLSNSEYTYKQRLIK